jgi:hypothetical protein
VVVTAGHERDAHRQVIDDAAEVVERHTIRTQQDEVLLRRVQDVDPALDLVHPTRGSVVRRAEPNHVARVRILGRIGTVPPRALKAEAVLGAALLVRFARGCDFVFRRIATIRVARSDQRFGVVGVNVEALALDVGAVVPTDFRALVPIETEPPHGVEHDLDALFGAALTVRVLDSKDERAVVLARPEPAVQRGPHPADVQIPRGGRRKPNANFRHGRRATRPSRWGQAKEIALTPTGRVITLSRSWERPRF